MWGFCKMFLMVENRKKAPLGGELVGADVGIGLYRVLCRLAAAYRAEQSPAPTSCIGQG